MRVSIYLDDELGARLERVRGDVSRSRFVQRALEVALDGEEPFVVVGRELAVDVMRTRAVRESRGKESLEPVVDQRALAREKQRKLNERSKKR